MGMDRKIEKKKGLKPKHYGMIAGALILGFLLFKLISTAGTSVYRADRDKVTLSTVEQGNFKDYISIIGTVEPNTTIYLDVEEGGKVVEKVIDEGEIVHKGDVIVRLKNNDLNNWNTFSKNALDHFKICLRYSTSDEIKRIISDQINQIEE